MEFLWEIGLFLTKAIIVVGSIVAIISAIAAASSNGKGEATGHIKVRHLSEEFKESQKTLNAELLDAAATKKLKKQEKKEAKAKKKEEKRKAKEKTAEDFPELNPRVFVIDFHGDIRASAVSQLREEITALLGLARPEDEILVRLESSGGMVHSYGLASSQLQRIRDRGIPLTIAVDKVAASGGYMMACLADKLLSAPFAIIGSIGVMAQVPNIHNLLKKNDVDVELHTAGKYKRTLTVLGENTEEGRQKFVDDLTMTHDLFKEFVMQARPVVNIEEIATGEIWYGTQAIAKQMVDELKTSDAYLCECFDRGQNVYLISWSEKKTLAQKIGLSAENAMVGAVSALWEKLQNTRFPA